MMVSLTAQNTSFMFSVSVGDQRGSIEERMRKEKKKQELEQDEKIGPMFTCGASEVGINDFFGVWIQVYEHSQDELSCCYCILLRT